MTHSPQGYVYICSETNTPDGIDLFTVGFYAPDSTWQPESDHQDREEAARRVAVPIG